MKTIFFVFALMVCTTSGILAQTNYIDSLKKAANTSTDDSSKLNALLFLSGSSAYSQPDSGLLYARKCLELSQKINYPFGKAVSNFLIAENLNQLGDYPSALNYALQAMSSFEEAKDTSTIIFSTELLGGIYRDEGDYKQALEYFYKNRQLYESQPDGAIFYMLFVGRPKKDGLIWCSVEIGNCYIYSNPDSAIFYGLKGYEFYKAVYHGTELYPLVVAGGGYVTKNQPDSALKWYRIGLETTDDNVAKNDLSDVYIGMAKAFLEKGITDSCIYYAEKALSLSNKISYLKGVYDVTNLLAAVYENVDPKKSVKYYKLNKATYDSIYSRQKVRDAENVAFNERIQREEVQQKIAAAELANRNREQLILLLSGLTLVVFIAVALWRRNIFKQKAYALLQKQKEEIDKQKIAAEIETALERVRSCSLAMHHSEELGEVVTELFKQMVQLGVVFDSININILHPGTKGFDSWLAVADQPKAMCLHVPYFDNPVAKELSHAVDSGIPFFSKTYSREEKNAYFYQLFELTDFKRLPDERKNLMLNAAQWCLAIAIANNTVLSLNNYSGHQFTEGDFEILKRFSKVFHQSYTRFLDLQKAEVQAREAQIEAALERVRAKTMGMHEHDDLLHVIETLGEQLASLGFVIHDTAFSNGLCERDWDMWIYSPGWRIAPRRIIMPWFDHAYFKATKNNIDKYYKQDGSFFINVFTKEEKDSFLDYILFNDKENWALVPDETKNILYAASGYTWSAYFLKDTWVTICKYDSIPYTDEENKILGRFANAFGQAYTRFLDLQKSEAATKEAVKQAALDRIRGDIASMRSVNDLDKITPIIWNELTTLGISFIRCGVFIMDDEHELIHTYLSTPDGKAIAAFHLPFDIPGHFPEIVNDWRNKKIYVGHWAENDFTGIAETLVRQGAIETKEQYLNTLPHGGFYLHCLPFLQGMLYVGNTTRLNDDDIKLIQSVADTFSTAYARYEDFNKLEAAKQQTEKTLTDLKQTQQQLIQAEKMAGLGELTAGIAHEIQNPLNFVNNFSEVNKELIEEVEDERHKMNGGRDEVLEAELLSDIKQNNEKISFHGKRADAIVKSMMQHSRTSSGHKELTDINALCDEYLRLSYYGMRAKDKDFNATLETDFDNSIGKINIVPQDIGRVLLNLFNNAFYAMMEKQKGLTGSSNPSEQQSYVPTVAIVTKKLADKIEIKVKDNGSGIPQNIVDKIFQPFFTTKPTGQGTGLGLSLSYDIIKAHGGEIKVESREARPDDPVGRAEGSEFIIQFPIA